jgi:hypothetical protein
MLFAAYVVCMVMRSTDAVHDAVDSAQYFGSTDKNGIVLMMDETLT